MASELCLSAFNCICYLHRKERARGSERAVSLTMTQSENITWKVGEKKNAFLLPVFFSQARRKVGSFFFFFASGVNISSS